ncbi:hypothetical protein F0562_015363 [Nyssa sinensis]|uniref:Uncharacterized protein n=1 Tax=Nyssa sinensis TaxID=561372 RepID=A0A5J4ZIJ3_9ASTE|nr:hypothetical protein F0562_015363 [Nyssa sinensis]
MDGAYLNQGPLSNPIHDIQMKDNLSPVAQESNANLPLVSSAPPFLEEVLYEGPIHYPSIDLRPVDSDTSSSVNNSSVEKDSDGGSLQLSHLHSIKKARLFEEHVQCATNRRRGIIEDLHLTIEIFKEVIFDVVHKATHCLMPPFDTSRTLLRWFYFHNSSTKDIPASSSNTSVSTAAPRNNNPTPTEKNTSFHQSLNTDSQACQNVITEYGYPYDAIKALRLEGAGLEWIDKEGKTSLITASMTLELFNVANTLIEPGAI